MARTIIVSNRLPINIEKKDGKFHYTPSPGGLVSALNSVYANEDNLWVGWPGLSLTSREEKAQVTAELKKERMHPVFIPQKTFDRYYGGFSNGTLWPLFHYYPRLTHIVPENWESYKKANQLFADELASILSKGDNVWVHDYHLFLLPQLIRERFPNVRIGFFQHIPFPSYEIFRILPPREELLRGVLASDLIGFHTYDDMRHFLSASQRILGLSHVHGVVQMPGHTAKVDTFPIGIDYDKYEQAAGSPEVREEIGELTKTMKGKRIILSVDRLDISKGIPEKLRAYGLFLEKNPEYREKVTLVLVVVPSRTEVEIYQDLKEEIEKEVGQLNGKFGVLDWTPINYLYKSVSANTLSALYRMADVALITPLRDGMNLVSKEYIASKKDSDGVLILSEMAGASKELSDALIINPNNIEQVAQAIVQALTMPSAEQQLRLRNMQIWLRRNNVHRWAQLFLEKLSHTGVRTEALTEKSLGRNERKRITQAYEDAKKRMLLLDYDGTLVDFTSQPQDAKPDRSLLNLLKSLSADPDNTVIIISGRDRTTLENWFEGIPLHIIAEHGVWQRTSGGEWIAHAGVNANFKDDFKPLLQNYLDRTPGTMLEEKEYALAWHYRNADPDFGQLRARELITDISYLAANRPLRILEGNKVIELKHSGVDKGLAALAWLQRDIYDFMMAIGDDATDEDLFKAMPPEVFTIKVGSGPTAARGRLDGPRQVRHLLKSLLVISPNPAGEKDRRKRFKPLWKLKEKEAKPGK